MRHNQAKKVQHTATAKSVCTTDKVLTKSSCRHKNHFSEMTTTHSSEVQEIKWLPLTKQALRHTVSILNNAF